MDTLNSVSAVSKSFIFYSILILSRSCLVSVLPQITENVATNSTISTSSANTSSTAVIPTDNVSSGSITTTEEVTFGSDSPLGGQSRNESTRLAIGTFGSTGSTGSAGSSAISLEHFETSTASNFESIPNSSSSFLLLETPSSVLLPKCCPTNFAVSVGNCSETVHEFRPKFDVHIHNETAFDDAPIDPSLIDFRTFEHNPCKSKKFPLSPEENSKLLLNGSLLLTGFGEYDGMLGYDDFCVDNVNDPVDPEDSTVYVFVCLKEHFDDGYPGWVFSLYIALVSISALLFASSAIFFYKQDVQGVHKKSFMAFSIAMSCDFVVIVLNQFIPEGCKIFGLILQFFLTMSFSWLAILCFDLAWNVHFYSVKDNSNRFKYYVMTSLIFSTFFVVISMANGMIPDIPMTFLKPQFEKTKSCLNFAEDQRRFLFYSMLGLTLISSAVFLIYALVKMNRNRYENSDQGVVQWKKVSKKFRYMYGRLLIVFVTMLAWFLDSFSDSFPNKSGIATIILVVQAFQGFIIVPLYTVKTVRKLMELKKKPRIENLEELIEISKSKTFEF